MNRKSTTSTRSPVFLKIFSINIWIQWLLYQIWSKNWSTSNWTAWFLQFKVSLFKIAKKGRSSIVSRQKCQKCLGHLWSSGLSRAKLHSLLSKCKRKLCKSCKSFHPKFPKIFWKFSPVFLSRSLLSISSFSPALASLALRNSLRDWHLWGRMIAGGIQGRISPNRTHTLKLNLHHSR